MHPPNPPLDSIERQRLNFLLKQLNWPRKPRGLDFFLPVDGGYLEIGCRKTKRFATLMTADPFAFREICYEITHE